MPEPTYKIEKALLNLYAKFRANLPVILIVPTVLGGMLQAIQLLLISPVLIRFFSVSQLLSDGILIIGISFLLLLLPYYLARIAVFSLNKLKTRTRVVGISVILSVVVLCEVYYLFFQDSIKSRFDIFIMVCISMTCIFTMCLAIKQGFFLEFVTAAFNRYYLFIVLTISLSGAVLFSALYFHTLIITTPIANFSKLHKKYAEYSKMMVLYFNDKYIFVKVINKQKESEIHIEKIELLFD